LREITAHRKTRWFNGQRFWSKAGILLEVGTEGPIAVALPKPVAARWESALESRGREFELPRPNTNDA
jgi:hypothetical protein